MESEERYTELERYNDGYNEFEQDEDDEWNIPIVNPDRLRLPTL